MPDARTRFQSPKGVQVREHSIPEATPLCARNTRRQHQPPLQQTPRRARSLPFRVVFAVLGLSTVLLFPGRAVAQGLPEPAEAMAAFNKVRTWVDAISAPPESDMSLAALPDCPASVTIRYAGRIVGRGVSFAPGRGAAIREASARAIREASGRVPIPVDPDLRREVARSLVLSLELASPPVPVAPDAMKDLYLTLSPGIHGVAARLGDRVEGLFPGTMLATGTEPRAAIGAVAAAVTGSPENAIRDPLQVRRDLGVSFLTFRTTHLAQSGAGASPHFLYRGSGLPTASPPTVQDLESLTDRIVSNLLARETEPDHRAGIAGTYLPLQDRYEPSVGSPIEQGLVAIALARSARRHGGEKDVRDHAARLARRIIEDLAFVGPEEIAPDASPMSAAIVSIATRTVFDGDQARPDAVAELLRSCDRRMDEADIGSLSGPERSFLAWGMSVRARRSGSPEHASTATRLVREAFLNTPAPMLVGQMPWLLWAEQALAPADAPIPASESLRQMRAIIWTHQVRPEDGGDDGADMVGGILFTGASNPLPTAQSLRAIAATSSMIADPRLTPPEELPRELARLLGGVRFIGSLTAHEATCHMFASPERASGGVRASLWDQRMPPESGALAILILCDLLDVVSPSPSTGSNAHEDGRAGAETGIESGGQAASETDVRRKR